MTQRLFIHIGTHKTGSTTIQAALLNSTHFLKKRKINYLTVDWAADIMRIESIEPVQVHSIKRSFQSTSQRVRSDHTIVLSSEKLSGNPYKAYSNAPILAEVLKEISEGFETRIIAYLRRQDSFLESLYTQSIHQGEQHTFYEFLRESRPENYNWDRFISCFEEKFGTENVEVRSYDYLREQGSNSLLQDFLQSIDLKDFDAINKVAKPTNVSYSLVALDYATRVNKYFSGDYQKAFRRGLQNSNQSKESKKFFIPEDRIKVLKNHLDSNEALAKRKLNEAEGASLCYIPELESLKEEQQALDRVAVLEEVLARYIAYNESKASAEPREILRFIYRKYLKKNF